MVGNEPQHPPRLTLPTTGQMHMTIKPKPVVRLRPASYQPTKAELDEDMSIDTTPEELAKVAFRPVTVKIIGEDDQG